MRATGVSLPFQLFALLLLAGFSLSLSAQTGDNLNWQAPGYIEDAFVEIALNSEYKKSPARVKKWLSPIRYRFIYHDTPPFHMAEQLFQAHLQHLQSITGHPITQTLDAGQSNLDIVLTRDRYYKREIERYTRTTIKHLERKSHCMAHLRTEKSGEIKSAVLILPLDHVMSRGLLPACVVEESTQIMGLPNDSDWVNPSIANDKSRLDLLTGLDYIMLKLLYTPDLQTGMNEAATRAIIKQKIKQLQKKGEIERASKRVNQKGLYPLIY